MIAIRIPFPRRLRHMRRERRHTGPRDGSVGRHDLEVERPPSDDAVLGQRIRGRGGERDDVVVEGLE